jgi:hypothetical protein
MTEANRNVVTPPRLSSCSDGEGQAQLDKAVISTGYTYTGFGIDRNTPEILPRTPKMIKKMEQANPALRLAQRVRAMTPLFWAKMDMGVTVNMADLDGRTERLVHLSPRQIMQVAYRRPAKPSAKTPPDDTKLLASMTRSKASNSMSTDLECVNQIRAHRPATERPRNSQ